MSNPSVLSGLIDQYAQRDERAYLLLQILHEIDRLLHVETSASDPSVPEKVWLIHYSDRIVAVFDGADANTEVADGYADSCSGPYRLVA